MTDIERREAIEAYQSKMKEAIDILQEASGFLTGDIVCKDELMTLSAEETLDEYIVALMRMTYAEWTNV